MSNAERQRKFVAANPGYYARLKARQRAAQRGGTATWQAEVTRLVSEGRMTVVPLAAAGDGCAPEDDATAPTAC